MAWALAGVLTITGALCCAELAAMWPRAGGQYVFLREAYGPSIGFLFGWGLFLIIQSGTIAAVAVAFANFAGVLTNSISGDSYLVAPLVLVKPFNIGSPFRYKDKAIHQGFNERLPVFLKKLAFSVLSRMDAWLQLPPFFVISRVSRRRS